MPKPTQQCKAGAKNIIRLARILYTRSPRFPCTFPNLSRKEYWSDPFDEEKAQPLDEIRWNDGTKRYEILNDSTFTLDDAILQAMVMLLIVARVKKGWSQTMTCAQLSTWPNTSNTKVPRQTNLTPEWKDEIENLKMIGKLKPKQQNSIQNYNTFASIYADDGCWPLEARAGSKWAPFNTFTEHSVIQWALNERGGNDHYISHLSVVLLKELMQDDVTPKERIAIAEALYEILWDEGQKENEDEFCKTVLGRIENLDKEDVISSFESRSFLGSHLLPPNAGGKTQGILRVDDARDDLQNMVLEADLYANSDNT